MGILSQLKRDFGHIPDGWYGARIAPNSVSAFCKESTVGVEVSFEILSVAHSGRRVRATFYEEHTFRNLVETSARFLLKIAEFSKIHDDGPETVEELIRAVGRRLYATNASPNPPKIEIFIKEVTGKDGIPRLNVVDVRPLLELEDIGALDAV